MHTFTTHTLLDASRRDDAAACGYDAEADGLKVVLEAHPQVGPCVSLSKYGAEIELFGDAEIDEVIRALTNAKLRSARMAALAMAAE